MFEDLDYKHTAKVSRDAWFLRLWCWAWESEPEQADFCKLFWGYVFMPLNLFVRVVSWPIMKLLIGLRNLKRWVGRKMTSSDSERTMDRDEWLATRELEKVKEEESDAKKKRREERIAKFFGVIGSGADRVVSFFQATWPFTRWIFYLLCAILVAALTGGLIWGVTELVGTISGNFSDILHALLIALIVVAIIAVIVVTGVSLIWFFLDSAPGKVVKRFFRRTFGAFGHAMLMGLIAIKTRTCPKIELVEEDN